MTHPLIIALDFPEAKIALDFVKQFPQPEELFVKVGMELYYHAGPLIIRELKMLGCQIFLDLKLHDIPHTVEQAATVIGQLGVELTTIHAAGGQQMMQAAVAGINAGAAKANVAPAKLLAITQLTSTSEQMLHHELAVDATLTDSVDQLAQLAAASGVNGVISSALEVPHIKTTASTDFLCISPGIRLHSQSTDDQVRIVTPAVAQQLGSDGIVVGRPITKAANPVATYQHIKMLWEGQ
ncbi:orotidine-5'-phosphate decarboxylase [Lapidilactobacillus bayanensis]|uniref:orotidine-5'-phosphate decarboxylase n=1 Tax=Lapidilactobacillus bayanensis TaxID=2485998 RepID=UPI000F767B20|nr:orotidine-5'-phosphate decarboxylase [Lapidilactobacillus bayanensis]